MFKHPLDDIAFDALSLTKAFKTKHPDLKITTVKEYMGVIFFEKTKYDFEGQTYKAKEKNQSLQ